MKSGEYYIGDLAWILQYENLEFVSSFEDGEIGNFADGSEFVKFEVAVGDYADDTGFLYSVKSEIFGIIPAKFIDKEFLSESILTYKNSVIANKFTGYPVAKVHEFKDDFQIERGENFIKFGEIVVKLTK
ncbi:MAG: hypothetical protein II923_08105 [Campylobacter sp.]|nr:hypothetical protein [Campylobacter sp.]